MARRLPPLNALRAFEAAARHQSFAAAAEELCVTPGAISRQIKTLEDYFGAPVFDRDHRKVTLTPESRAFAQLVKEVFERLQMGAAQMASQGRHKPLHIVCPITFASRWLIPRISAFTAVAPEIQIRLTTAVSLVRNLATITDADVSIEYRKDTPPGFMSNALIRSRLIPVCSPALAGSIKCAEDFKKMKLLHSSTRNTAWQKWAVGAGMNNFDWTRGMQLSSLALAYQVAAEGVGVAIGDLDLVASDLAIGKLVAPMGPVVHTDDLYTLVYPEEQAGDPRIVKFRHWLTSEVAKSERPEAPFLPAFAPSAAA